MLHNNKKNTYDKQITTIHNNKGGANKNKIKSVSKQSNESNKHNKQSRSNNKIRYTKDEEIFINKEFKNMCKPYQYVPSIIDARDRVIVLGDIHGDLELTIDMITQSGIGSYDS